MKDLLCGLWEDLPEETAGGGVLPGSLPVEGFFPDICLAASQERCLAQVLTNIPRPLIMSYHVRANPLLCQLWLVADGWPAGLPTAERLVKKREKIKKGKQKKPPLTYSSTTQF